MENIENIPHEGLNSVQSMIKEEKMAFFEVNRTPPDERRRREKAAELAATQVPEVLLLTPFTSIPRIEFERIKLGRSGVRRLVVRNPGDKPMEVILEKLPKEEKGFSIDYVAFRLGGREETTLLIGWTPVKGGGVRDNFIVKFGKFSAQVILIGSCIAPEVKISKPRPTNSSMTRPLGPKNTNIKPGPKTTRPSVPASKLTAAPKITIPSNPVVRKSDSPTKRLITGSSPPPLPHPPKVDSSFVCGAEFNLRELPRPETDNTPRRETFVHERPQPRGGDVVESTPIVSSRTETFRDIRRETMVVEANTRLDFGYSVPSMPPPQLTDIRRQTFVPKRSDQVSQGMSRRQTYVKLPQQESGTIPPVERRKWSLESVDLARDPDVSGMVVGDSFVSVQTPEILKRVLRTSEPGSVSKAASEVTSPSTEDIPLNLSVAPLNLSARPKVLNDMLAQFLDNTEHEPLNLSAHAKEGSDDQAVDPPLEPASPAPMNLKIAEPTKTPTIMTTSYKPSPKPYCPQVSDISLPEASPCLPTPKLLGTPLKDPRLLQLMSSFNISGNGSLDLSMGSQFGDCSMAVNMASPARDREKDLEEELENIEDNKETWEDAELEMIAKARGTSALGKSQTSPQVERGDRLSSGTVVKTAPCLDPGVVPVIGVETHEEVMVVEERECMLVMEEEVKISEVIEEVIEYEYEIVGGERRLVGERNLGRTVSCQSETMTRTPVKSMKSTKSQVTVEPECDVSRLIEEQLSGSAPSDICVGSPTPLPRPRAVDLTADQLDRLHTALPYPTTTSTHPDQVFNISLHQTVQIPPLPQPPQPHPPQHAHAVATLPKSPEPMVRHLPGLRGSPRISNQMSSHPESFLQVTINETSFMPPSPDDPRRCSTGVKHKENMPVMSPSPNAEVRKSLFSPDLPRPDTTETQTMAKPDVDNSGFVPLNSLGYELPIIDSPSSESKCRLSSDTYIATVESPALSTIQETDETDSSKQNGTFEKNARPESSRPGSRVASRPQSRVGEVSNNAATTNTTFDKSKDVEQQNSNMENKTFEKEVTVEPTEVVVEEVEEVKTVIKERTPARPRRSNISYTPQDIATIAMSKNSVENLAMSEDQAETGLMFFPISPTQSEKRKPDIAPLSEQSKRSKTVIPASRPVVRAGKNPLPPRITGKRLQVSQNKSVKEEVKTEKTKTTKLKELQRKSVSQSLPPKPTASRVTQPARRLHLVKPSKPGMVHHPNPFAARNQYYDERWIDKQERGFTRWLNFILTPQVLEDSTDMLPGKVDVAKLWTQCSKDVKVPRAPTREVMSMRAYTARREMNRLRRAACKIWQSREVAAVIGKVEFEIEKLRLVIRKDRNITKDVGMKQALLKIILSYNPLWLRIGLETVYGELLPVSTNSDLLGLSRFLVIRLLSNPDILAEYAHPTVPHCYRDGHQEALNRFALKKFLELVYFLDIAKETRLIRHNPCLFCPDSQFKTSRDVLLTFSKDYLSGEGDITKHMAYMGYIVNHKQTKLDEFDYAVTNIKTDLRCGLRLVKVAELVTGVVASSNMRVPAVSRLQKVHNTDVALAAYKEGGLDMPKSITAKDIVDGHREKTLQLLWTIIFGYQLNATLDLQKLKEEIVHLKRSLVVRARMGDASAQGGQAWLAGLVARSPQQGILAGESLGLVMEWAQLVMAHYQVEVENWTVSWCDGRGLCLLVHHYQPDLLARSDIKDQTSLTHQAGNQNLDDSLDFNYGSKAVDPSCYEAYLENEKANFKLLFSKVSELGGVPILITPGDMSNTIPDEKVTATFIGYLAARLLDLSREIKAARTIQLAWRRFSAVRKEEELKVQNQAASIIQSHVRQFLGRRRRERYGEAALVLQKYARGLLARRELGRRRLAEEEKRVGFAALIIQAWWRGVLARRERKRMMKALVVLQAGVRGMLVRMRNKKERVAVKVIQTAWRRLLARRKAKEEEMLREKAAVVLQSVVRRWIVQRRFKTIKQRVVMVQAMVRGRRQRVKYLVLRKAACCIQRQWRAVKQGEEVRRAMEKQNKAAMVVQRFLRMIVARKLMRQTMVMVVRLQAVSRGWLVRMEISRRNEAAGKIQVWWRNVIRSKEERRNFEETKRKVVIVQSVMRRWVVRKRYLTIRRATVTIQRWVRVWRTRKEYKQMKVATTTIQRHWRSSKSAKQDRQQFLKEKRAAIIMQAWWRMVVARKKFRNTQKKVITIQSSVRQQVQRQRYLKMRCAALLIQRWWRSVRLTRMERARFLRKKKAALVIQAAWKALVVRGEFVEKKNSAIKLQSLWRMVTLRRKYWIVKKSSETIQVWWRDVSKGREMRKQIEVERRAATMLQAVWRGWRARRQFLWTRNAAVIIQTEVRRFLCRRRYLLVRKTAICLQRRVRANQQRDLAMRNFHHVRCAVIGLQAQYRGVVVRKEWRWKRTAAVRIQAWVRMVLQRRKFVKLSEAVQAMQAVFRRNMLAKQERNKFLARRKAAVKIQAWWRMLQCKQSYSAVVNIVIMLQSHFRRCNQERRFRQQRNAAIVMQRMFRKRMEGKICRERFLAMKKSAVVLQTRWRARQARIKFSKDIKRVVMVQAVVRGFLAKKRVNIVRKFQLETAQAIIIQRHVRGWRKRRKFRQLKAASEIVQSWWKAALAGREERKQFLVVREAALTIQSVWRGTLARRQHQEQVRCVTRCQAVVRGWLVRRQASDLRRVVTNMQMRLRSRNLTRRGRESFLRMRQSSIIIQSWWRGVLQRKIFNKEMKQVVICQAVTRGWLVRRQAKNLERAVILVLNKVRCKNLARKEREGFLRMKSSSVIVQSWWRGVRQRRNFDMEMSKVIICQALVRGWLVRKQARTLEKAVTMVQNKVRSRNMARKERENFLRMKSSSIVVQAWWRGVSQRRKFDNEVSKVIMCQAVVKRWLQVKQFQRMKNAVTILQRKARAWAEGRRMRTEFVMKREATVRIQALWRGHLQRSRFRRDINRIVKMQAMVRGKLVRDKFVDMKLGAVCIQNRWRALIAGRQAREAFLAQREGAVKVQTWWRMVKEKRKFSRLQRVVVACQACVRGGRDRTRYLKVQRAAIMVQRWFRGFREMKEERGEFLRKRDAVVVIQGVVRGWFERKRLMKAHEAACLIQRNVRGWMARRKVETLRQERQREVAVTLLQRQWRMVVARRRMREMLEQRRRMRAAVTLQTCVRGWMAKRVFTKQLLRTLVIQRWWRTTLLTRNLRKDFLKKRQSALTLQTWWRQAVARRQFCRQRSAARTLQGWARTQGATRRFVRLRWAVVALHRRWRAREMARIQQARYMKMRAAAITLQAMWRGRQARSLYKEKMKAVGTLQRCVRGWLARRYVDRKRAALLCLQMAIKRMSVAKRCRKEFLEMRRIAIGLQARSRGLLARRQFLRLQDDKEYREYLRKEAEVREEERRQVAARTITQVMRVVVERRRFLKVKSAATTIQKYWKGHWHRKVVMEQWTVATSRLSILKDIKIRLQEVNAAAKPEDSLGARTASAIDYIFSIKDVAQLICAVKTLDLSTRLSFDCCMKMREGLSGVSPVAQLVSLMTRCNRSVPHMEVVSTILDILLNVSRVVLTREAVAIVPNLLPDLFQTMLVYRDTGAEIFSKCCALLQVLSVCPLVAGLLAQSENAKKLTGYEMIVTKKRKLKEENQRRRSFNVSALPVPTARKPLRPTNSINQLNRTSSTMGLNSTMNMATATPVQPKQRNANIAVATGPPWSHQTKPRFHEDPVIAITALNKVLGLNQTKQ